MKKLLSTEWLKMKNYNAFIFVSIFFIIGVIITNYIVYLVNKNLVQNVNPGGIIPTFNPYSFESTWQTTSYATGWLLILPALLIIILVTNEYTYKTNRQNIIDGWSRNDFISVKLVLALIFAIASTILVFFTALGFGLFSGTDFSFNKISHVGFFFLKALTYNVVAVFISVLVKRTGFAIAVYFIYTFVENVISQLLDVWSFTLKRDKVADMGSMGDYLPMNAADGLLTFPDNPLKSLARNTMPTEYFWISVALAVFYLLLFTRLSQRKFLRADL